MSISIKPLEDRIVIRQVEAEQTTASGLVIPDTAKEKPQEGEVIAVGPGRVDDSGNRIPVDAPTSRAGGRRGMPLPSGRWRSGDWSTPATAPGRSAWRPAPPTAPTDRRSTPASADT